MLKPPITEHDLEALFSAPVLASGRSYWQQGRVEKLQISGDGSVVSAHVKGTRKRPYDVVISLHHYRDQVWVDGVCDCPLAINCKHVAAVLCDAIHELKPTTHKAADKEYATLKVGLTQIDQALQSPTAEPSPVDPTADRIVYILSLIQQPLLLLKVEPCLAKPLKKGVYGKPRPLPESGNARAPYLLPQDKQILHWLEFIRKYDEVTLPPQSFPLLGHNGVEILKQLLETGRCHWVATSTPPLNLGQMRKATLEWEMEPDGLQHLHCRIGGGTYTILPLMPPWYIDHERYQCGPLETGVDPAVVAALLAAPALRPEQIKQIYAALSKRVEKTQAPLPRAFTHERTEQVLPIPQLRLFCTQVPIRSNYEAGESLFKIKLPVAELSFTYAKTDVLWDDPRATVSYVEDTELILAPRRLDLEQEAFKRLQQLGIRTLSELPDAEIQEPRQQHYLVLAEAGDQETLLQFSLYELPKLREEGWRILVDPDYPYSLVNEEDTEWYSEIEDLSGQQWFNLELGIAVNGERINLLPILVEVLERYFPQLSSAAIAEVPDATKLIAKLPDGRYLPISIGRIRHILQILTELYDAENLADGNKLSLSKLRIGQVLELEDVFGTKNLRWKGGEQLRKLGEKLKNFTGIEAVAVPTDFQAELRPYQQDGLNWLQFLREYQLAGILADDMGLGKTVQTLAHLLVEKNSGRMDRPSLVIAPTSLMVNWRMEAQRFAPTLKVLTLHGVGRKPNFQLIKEHDLVLTTYPLLVRDHNELLAEQYHLLILDEAQVIKNPKSKAAQIVYRIDARHRLCLTGTPMENHLGELWSLFNFLLPGLLGSTKQFTQIFRVPIEKYSDIQRRASLVHRIAPFLLRRTKHGVIRELPDKIDIVRSVELTGEQRDLYETIRIAMHHQITQAIQNKGLEKSRILILDALLKLRQICCDPRLLKLSTAKQVTVESAKFQLLFDMLPNLIEEGRRILLFSQFTEMLKLIEDELVKYPFEYVKLTGQTLDRATPIQRFQAGEVPLFLISLKAGGTGLNLTAADTVIHYDPWWNPAVEHQATDRAHRIGQEKTVFVYKLITEGTVEEKIVALQERKQALLEGLFSEQGLSKVGLAAEDLEDLFKPLE